MSQVMMERIREESAQQVFSFAHQPERASGQIREQGFFADGIGTAGLRMKSLSEEGSSSVDALDAIAAVEAATGVKTVKGKTQAAKWTRAARAASMVGDFGQRKAQNLCYSSSEAQVETPSSPGGNRK